MNKNLLILNKTLFLFLFFIFKYFIFSNIYNKLNNKYIVKIFISDKKNIYFFYNIFLLLLYNNNLYKLLLYIIIKKIYINLYIYNLNLYILVELFKFNIYFSIFKFDYFKVNKNIKIFFFFDFYLRIDILLFITYKYYMNYFRLFKYNEYLIIHPNLYKYPLLKIFLRNFWVDRSLKYNKNSYTEQSLFRFFKIYIFNKKNDNDFKYLNINLSLKNINLYLNNFKLLKLLKLLKKNSYSFLYLYFGKFFRIHLYFFIYYIIVFNYEEDDWIEIKKLNLYSFESNFWQLDKYGFNIKSWLFMFILSYISNIYIKNYLYIYNLNSLDLINNLNYLKLSNSNIFWYCLIKLILIEKINFYYFFWLNDLVLKKNRKDSLIKYIKIWHILINSYIFQFINTNLINYNKVNLISYLNNIKFNLDFIFWNIFFIGTISYRIKFNYNITSILNKINIDIILYTKFTSYFDFFRFFLGYNFSSFFLINILFFFLFMQDLFIKILINKKIYLLKLRSKNFNILIYKKLVYTKKKFFFFDFKIYLALQKLYNYKIKNKNYYIFYLENNLIIVIYTIIINKYFL